MIDTVEHAYFYGTLLRLEAGKRLQREGASDTSDRYFVHI